MSVRSRFDDLKKKKGYTTDIALLRGIYKALKKEGRVGMVSEEDYVEKNKGSFNQMINEKRRFDLEYLLPLERLLGTSMDYLLNGYGAPADESVKPRGLRFAASSDTKGNYDALIDDGVYDCLDEYDHSLLDYMIEFGSKTGFEFFAKRDELPFDRVGRHDLTKRLTPRQCELDDVYDAILDYCTVDTALKYCDGFYYATEGIDPSLLPDEGESELMEVAMRLLWHDPIRKALGNLKEIPLEKVNSSIRLVNGFPMESGTFINLFFVLMLNLVFSWPLTRIDRNDSSKSSNLQIEKIQVELLTRAIELNRTAMESVFKFGFDDLRIGKYGYIYSDNDIVWGSIAYIDDSFRSTDLHSPAVVEKYNELTNQLVEFEEKISERKEMRVIGNELYLSKRNCDDFYAFYRMMNEKECEFVAINKPEKSDNHDCLILPRGEKESLSSPDNPKLFAQAIKVLSLIDSISEQGLGSNQIYAFGDLNARSFYVYDGRVTGIAPTEIIVGNRYDNLAAFLGCTCLLTPIINSSTKQIVDVVGALKAYGVKPADLLNVLDACRSYFEKTSNSISRSDDPSKQKVAANRLRALWCELYADDIKNQF